MKEFNEVDFKSKITNMFIQYLTGIMKNNIDEVKHFLKEQPISYANNIIKNMISLNRRQMYDELNVSQINITKTENIEDNTIYTISLLAKYLDYQLDLNNGNLVSGNNNRRIEKTYFLKIIKNNNAKEQGLIRRCPSCGHSIDVNYNGKCEYCGTIYNQEDYDYQILEVSEWKNML